MQRFISLLFIIISSNCFSQQVYTLAAVDEAPFIKECYDPNKDTKECFNQNMSDFVQSELLTPRTVKAEGKAYVQFVITETGEVKDIQVRATEQDQKEEIIRVLSMLKVERPASLKGNSVAITYSMPVIFKRIIFDSYTSYFESLAKGLPFASETAYPPIYEDCEQKKDQTSCFIKTTEDYISRGVKNAKKGAVLNYYFEIDENAEVKNVKVLSHNDNDARLEAAALLEDLKLKGAARNEAKQPVHTYFSGKLVL